MVMRRRTEIAIWSLVVVTSLGVHAAAFGGLAGRAAGGGAGAKQRRSPALVEMSVPPAPPPPPPPPAAPRPAAPRAAPRIATARAPARTAPRPAPPPASEAPPPAAETPADFTGVTMTNDGPGPGWASTTGNGQAMNGPAGRPGARVTGRSADGDPSSTRRGPPVVAAGDLSRAPEPPELSDALARAYPAEARSRGIEGRAVVRARIMPDGRVRELALLNESAPGFGAACQETLRGSSWSPPIDRDARPVSTFINYTCRFQVQ
jgi:periplasmic protein TonB